MLKNECLRAPASISQAHHLHHGTLDILSFPATVHGALDPTRMRLALQTVVNRHPALRTRFITEENPVQREIFPLTDLPLTFINTSFSSEADMTRFIESLEKKQRHNLPHRSQGPLFKCTFIQYAQDCSIFLLTMDHIICDAWSITLFTKELFETYETPEPAPLVTEDHFGDFVTWQNNKILRTQEDIIHNKKNLPLQTQAAKKNHAPSHREHLKLSVAETELLKNKAQYLSVSLFTLLLAAFKLLLLKAEHHDLPIRIVHSGRFKPQWKSTIGLFASSLWVNIPPIQSSLSSTRLITQTRQSLRSAIQRAYVPYEYLDSSPSIQVEIDYMPIDIFSHRGHLLQVDTLFDASLEHLHPDMDMQLLCYHHQQQLCFYLIYKENIIPHPYLGTLLNNFISSLNQQGTC